MPYPVPYSLCEEFIVPYLEPKDGSINKKKDFISLYDSTRRRRYGTANSSHGDYGIGYGTADFSHGEVRHCGNLKQDARWAVRNILRRACLEAWH